MSQIERLEGKGFPPLVERVLAQQVAETSLRVPRLEIQAGDREVWVPAAFLIRVALSFPDRGENPALSSWWAW